MQLVHAIACVQVCGTGGLKGPTGGTGVVPLGCMWDAIATRRPRHACEKVAIPTMYVSRKLEVSDLLHWREGPRIPSSEGPQAQTSPPWLTQEKHRFIIEVSVDQERKSRAKEEEKFAIRR